jgi:DNA-binding NarL/FixJ family response regulator
MNRNSAQPNGDHPGPPIKVVLLDDHEIVRMGVVDLLNAQSDMEIVADVATGPEVLRAVGALDPDVAVIDVRLQDGNGIEVCREIRSRFPEVACLILTSFADDHAIVDASLAGAAGYVLKQIRGNELVDSIRKVAAGAVLLDSAMVRRSIERLKDSEEGVIATLTPQERRIFQLIGDGQSNRQIADELFLAEKTVKNYVSNLLAKLGMSRRTEAAAFAARLEERSRLRYE